MKFSICKEALAVFFLGMSFFHPAQALAEKDQWVVASIEGGAWKSSDRDPYVRTAVHPGDPVHAGEQIETFQNNQVILSTDPRGQNIVAARGSFRMETPPGGGTHMQLERGRVLAVLDGLRGEGNFSVVTPTGVAAVRGTRFGVWAPASEMQVKTFRGEVSVQRIDPKSLRAQGPSVTLLKGQGTRLSSDAQTTVMREFSEKDWADYSQNFQSVRTARKSLKANGTRWFEEAAQPSQSRWVSAKPKADVDSKKGQTIFF